MRNLPDAARDALTQRQKAGGRRPDGTERVNIHSDQIPHAANTTRAKVSGERTKLLTTNNQNGGCARRGIGHRDNLMGATGRVPRARRLRTLGPRANDQDQDPTAAAPSRTARAGESPKRCSRPPSGARLQCVCLAVLSSRGVSVRLSDAIAWPIIARIRS